MNLADISLADLLQFIVPLAQSLILALIVAFVGSKVIKKIEKSLRKRFENSKMDQTLKPFLLSMIRNLLRILLIVTIINILGIDTTSIVAILAAAGFAVGLAFQGALSNFAGGVLLLFLKPFRVGDWVETPTHSGTVKAIHILHTELNTPDNKVIFIPNGNLSNASITNFSLKPERRLQLEFSASYDEDTEKVLNALKEVVNSHDFVLKDPEPFVRMSKHDASAVIYVVRVWVESPNFWALHWDLIEQVKRKFDKEKISIPYPQLDVHMKNKEGKQF